MDNRTVSVHAENIDVVSDVTESRLKPCFTIMAVTETKNIASFGAVTEIKFRSVSIPRYTVAVEIMSTAAQQYEKSRRKRLAIGK